MMFPEFDGPAIALHMPVPVHPRCAPVGASQLPSHSLESLHTRPASFDGKTHPCVEYVTLCIVPPRAAHSWVVFGQALNLGLSGSGGDVGDAAQAETRTNRKDASTAVRMMPPATAYGVPIVSCALAGPRIECPLRVESSHCTDGPRRSAIGQKRTLAKASACDRRRWQPAKRETPGDLPRRARRR